MVMGFWGRVGWFVFEVGDDILFFEIKILLFLFEDWL
jgi:hypothetical protein